MTPPFISAYEDVYNNGLVTTVNGKKVTAIIDGISIASTSDGFPARAGCNPAIGIIEGLQFIAGTAELSSIIVAAPGAKHELFGLNSFYGPRAAAQFPRVIDLLRKDNRTRQAVIMIAHPDDAPDTVPCTLSVQFQIDKWEVLTATYTMRSTDMVWGLPYDFIQFGMVAAAVANCVGCIGSDVVVNTANAHIYDSTAVRVSAWHPGFYMMPNLFDEWSDWQRWAKEVTYRRLSRSSLMEYFNVRS